MGNQLGSPQWKEDRLNNEIKEFGINQERQAANNNKIVFLTAVGGLLACGVCGACGWLAANPQVVEGLVKPLNP